MASEQVNNEIEPTPGSGSDINADAETTTSGETRSYEESLRDLPTEEIWELYHRKAAETGPRSKPIEPYRNAPAAETA